MTTHDYLIVALGLCAMLAGAAPPGVATAASVDAYGVDIGGRLQWDLDSYDDAMNPSGGGKRRFNSQLRRARIELSGDVPGGFDWEFDVNYLDDTNEAEIHVARLRYTGWDVANITFGRTKEPFGLEELESSKAISTMRRHFFAEATDADGMTHYGLELDGMIGRLGWSGAILNPADNPRTEDGSDRLAYTGRVFGNVLPEGPRVLHLGAAATDRNLDQTATLRGFAIRIAETADKIPSGSIPTRHDRQCGLEAYYLDGPFSLQGEHFWRNMDGPGDGPDAHVLSYYLQATWTVTGESRGYDSSTGVPSMIAPGQGRTAVELVGKIERIEFDPDDALDQIGRAYVLGVNVYPNRNLKLMFDISRLTTRALVAPGEPDDSLAISGRIQLAF